MSHLDLNSNDFRIEGEKVIATAVQKIDSLNLSFSRIAPYGYSHLSNAIKQRETRVRPQDRRMTSAWASEGAFHGGPLGDFSSGGQKW